MQRPLAGAEATSSRCPPSNGRCFVSSGERRLRRSSPHILNVLLRGDGLSRSWRYFLVHSSVQRPLAGAKTLPVAVLRRTVGVLFPPVNAGLAGVPTHSECSPPGRWAFPELALFFWCTPPCSGPLPELKPLRAAAPSNRRTPKTFLMEYFQASSRFLHTHAL